VRSIKPKNYKEYVRVQSKTTKSKLLRQPDRHFANPNEIKSICDAVKNNGVADDWKFGICHGVRNGWEVREFKKHFSFEIIGTDISKAATKFKYVIHHDFHNVKDEWLCSVDFIYTNSLDHSYDPKLALQRWVNCLTENGRLFITWTPAHGEMGLSSETGDIFAASKEEYRDLLNTYGVVEHEFKTYQDDTRVHMVTFIVRLKT